jgi:hypothetical protein
VRAPAPAVGQGETERVGIAVTLYVRIREVFDSNIPPPLRFPVVFLNLARQIQAQHLDLSLDLFLPNHHSPIILPSLLQLLTDTNVPHAKAGLSHATS